MGDRVPDEKHAGEEIQQAQGTSAIKFIDQIRREGAASDKAITRVIQSHQQGQDIVQAEHEDVLESNEGAMLGSRV